MRRRSKIFGVEMASVVLVCAGGIAVRAGWTPPESSVTPPAVLTLDAFATPALNGRAPVAPLVVGPDGALYGSTQYAGTNGAGTLFRLETDGSFSVRHAFNGGDGGSPVSALVVGADGAMYGSTEQGGASGKGTLFRLETNGTFTKLHDFNGSDGAYPEAALVVGPDAGLYGSTYRGGGSDKGTLFRMGTNGTFTKLHDFNGADGWTLFEALVVGPDGALYGSTDVGGAGNNGTLFRLQTNGSFTKLHDFTLVDGVEPEAPLVVGPDGAFYGSTLTGGLGTNGTLFRVDTNGLFTKLHDFSVTDGTYPRSALVMGPDAALYGAAPFGDVGGTSGNGTLFRLQTDGTFTKLHAFNGPDGANPSGPLTVGPDGALYGSSMHGGTGGMGTLFLLQTNGLFTKLYDFFGPNGAEPSLAMVVGPDGAMYAPVSEGDGDAGADGILFKLVLNRPPVARCHDVTVSAGANCAADASVDNGSFDPDAGDTITLHQEPPAPYPLGITPVTLTVTDNHGVSASCTATVTVMDTTPPTIGGNVAATPSVLWPPNGKMVEVTVEYAATDDCGAVTNALNVTSNEAPSGSALDWLIEDSHHVQLRAERSSGGTGRVYVITVISTDNAGNSATRTVTVTVPENQGK
jgi:uncharacterized repeat protein (TIGR03803 family)